MSKQEHWFADLNIEEGLRLMRAFTRMGPANRAELIRLAELQAEAAQAAQQGSRVVRLGVADGCDALVAPVLNRLSSAQPRVEVDLRRHPSAALLEMIGEGSLDAAVVARDPHGPQGDVLRSEPLVWAASKAGQPRRPDVVPLAAQHGCPTRRYAVEALEAAGRAFEIVLSSPSHAEVLQAVRSGIAVAAVPRCALADDLAALGPEHGLPDLPALELALVRRPGAGAAAEALADAIRDELTAA